MAAPPKKPKFAERAYAGMSPSEAVKVLDALIAAPSGVGTTGEQIDRLGQLVDLSGDCGRADGIERALVLGSDLLSRSLPDAERALLHYSLGNAHAIRLELRPSAPPVWDDQDVAQQIIHLRHSVRLSRVADEEDESGLLRVRRCQTLTNLGNLMSRCGRFIEALAYWDEALRVDPDFPMAHGNRGFGLVRYAGHVHDPGHQALHVREAYRALSRSLAPPSVRLLDASAQAGFAKRRDFLVKRAAEVALDLEAPPQQYQYDQGKSTEELAYRNWCLAERLFLNDLNDLGADPIAAADVLTLPGLTTSVDKGVPSALGMFNQLKQTFVTARFLFYEGEQALSSHYSDHEVTLTNTLDYSQFGLATEKLRLAFRAAYSILDQIAFLLNDYLGLGIPERGVTFKTLWYSDVKKGTFRPELAARLTNEPLQALFWLSKDLFERSQPEFTDALDPDAQELSDIRNHLEHKYLKIHMIVPEPNAGAKPPFLGDRDPLAHSISREDFARRTLRVLRLVRGALIYLALALTVEEELRREVSRGDKRTATIPLTVLPNDQKL